ncbi:hypothetical protein Hokovirus_3_180 [Hokovirus HKV1]|uniref:Uncharacterized protein n=1 Tax=Hokovirus HKV1 TaxID=1977638 RepID=A0A1V0SGR4_9VIRU|nr:hypothetical protein Hokovirus_3_180 [Hokovirus HKV1]
MKYFNDVLNQEIILTSDNVRDLLNYNNLKLVNYNNLNNLKKLEYEPYVHNNKIYFSKRSSMINYIKNRGTNYIYNDLINKNILLNKNQYKIFSKINNFFNDFVEYKYLPILNEKKCIFLDRESIKFFIYHNFKSDNIINYIFSLRNNEKFMVLDNIKKIKINNPIFNKYVIANYNQFSEWIFLNKFYVDNTDTYHYKTNYYPIPNLQDIEDVIKMQDRYLAYQSYDMKTQDIIRFGEYDKMLLLRNYQNSLIVNNFDNISIIDFYKMERFNENSFKYIYQLSQYPEKNIVNVNNIFDEIKNTNFNHVFIPYVDNELLDFNITKHKIYNNIQIIEEDKFITYIKSLFDETKQEIFVFNLLKYFNSINDLKINSAFSSKMNILWNFKYNEIYKVFKKRNDTLKNISKVIINSNEDCNDVYNTFLNNFSLKSNKISDIDFINNFDINRCLVEKYNLKILIDEDIENYKDHTILNKCPNMRFNSNTMYVYNGVDVSNYLNCDKFIEKINDSRIKKGMELFIEYLLNKVDNRLNNSLKSNNENIVNIDFKLYEYYMPEWSYNIINNNYEGVHNSKQVFLGDLEYIDKIKKCNILTKSIFVNLYQNLNSNLINLHIDNVSWDMDINKSIITCVANSNLIFPIRFIIPINKLATYVSDHNNIDDKYLFIGNVITKLDIMTRENKIRYYNTFLYCNKNNYNIVSYNFRGNNTFNNIPGTDNFKVTFVELETLKYYEKDYGIKLYFYIIKETINQEKQTFFVSKYNRQEIIQKYKNLNIFTDEETNGIIDNLINFEWYKDHNKRLRIHLIN